MNRIYQGRVSSVETPNPGDEETPWRPLDNWESRLWQHHELFQDAVNYYLLALLALANEKTPGLGSVKQRVASAKKEDEEYHVWQRIVLPKNWTSGLDGALQGKLIQ